MSTFNEENTVEQMVIDALSGARFPYPIFSPGNLPGQHPEVNVMSMTVQHSRTGWHRAAITWVAKGTSGR